MPKIPAISRDKFSREVREYLRQMNDRVISGRVYPGMNFGLYSNEGGHGSMRLPRAPRNEAYYEGRCGTTRGGAPGRYRFVFLVQGTPGQDAVIIKRYYTQNHYLSFAQIVD